MLIPTLLLACATAGAEATIATETEPFELILWLDHFDYVTGVPDTTTWSTMTPQGIDTIIDYHAKCGRPTVAFRDFAGGLIRHNSELELGQYPRRLDKRRGWDMREYSHHIHYGEAPDDVLTSVLNSCRKRSLPCIIYWPFEDTHGIPCFYSRFALEHPQFWERHLSGLASPARLCLAYPEVRRYKLDILREELGYGVEGVMFDFRRQSGRSGQGGYNEIIAEAWRAKHGADPPTNYGDLEWIRFRAAYVTQFLREVRAVLDSVEPRRRLIASIPNAGPNPERALRASFTDWPTWVEEGLLDGLAVSELPIAGRLGRPPNTSYRSDGFEGVCRAMQAIHKQVAGRCKVYWPLKWYNNWALNLATTSGISLHACLREYTKRAWEAGAAGFVVDTYDYQMAGLDAQTQAVLTDLFVNRYPMMKPGRVGTPRRVTMELPRRYEIPRGEDEPGLCQLTQGPGNHDEPAWSPDSKQVAFQSDQSGNLDVWVVPSDGGQARRLTDSFANDCFPAWSPDGSQLAFASDRDDGFYHLFVMKRDGGSAKQLTVGPHQDFLPAWSSDGRRILFTSTRAKGAYDCSVWQVAVDGGDPEPVFGPAQGGYLMSAEGGLDVERNVLTCSLVTSNMDNWILAAYPLGDPQPEEVIELTANRHSCYASALDPTGQVVAFTGNLKGSWDLYAQRLGATEPRRLTQHPATDANPCWSPAGTRVAFASNRSGTYKLYTLPVPKIPDGGSAAKWGQRLADLRERTRRTAEERPYLDVAHGTEHRNSVASAGYGHLVGQSFVTTRSGELLKLRLNMTHDALDRPLTVMLREDARGKPEGAVLAQTNVSRDAFEHTPRYGWVEVRFEVPPRLEKGKTYWIYMPQSGRYHWAIDTHNGYRGGQAFSDTYGYGGYDWIFEVYVK